MKASTFIVILFTLIFVSCTVGVIADDYDWPRWRGPKCDSISSEKSWLPKAVDKSAVILWVVDVGIGHSNVAIKDNRLYTMGVKAGQSVVYCLNAETGKEIWRHSSEEGFETLATPTIDEKYVYTLSRRGILKCLETRSGDLFWEKDLISECPVFCPGYGFAGSPAIEGNLIILNANYYGLALDKHTGTVVWVSDKYHPTKSCLDGKNAGGYSTPKIYTINGKRCALLNNCTGLHSVDVRTGEQLWYYEWFSYQVPDPVVFNHKIFISTYEKSILLDITGNEPKELWKSDNLRNHFSTSVYIDGYLYGSDGMVGPMLPFRCIKVKTGEVMWEEKMNMISIIAAGKKLILLETDGTLHVVKATPKSYKEISKCDVLNGKKTFRKFWTPPVLCNEKIYCRNYAGDLVCIDVSK